MDWSATQYTKFETERTRPAIDLLNAVRTANVERAVDLGCGPGNSTALIAARYPDAKIAGVDSAPDMIDAARVRLPNVQFELADIQTWDGEGLWDLIFANAALQWVPDHTALLPRLVRKLSAGGSLAVQMPDNLNEASHAAMREIAMRSPFAAKLAFAANARTALPDAAWYYAALKPHASKVDIWRTTYYHVLSGGISAIVEWLKGTGLMPFLKPLNDDERQVYILAYQEALAKQYSLLEDGSVVLPFPRVFMVGMR